MFANVFSGVPKSVMNKSSRVEGSGFADGVTVSFGDRFQASAQFDLVFREGMELVSRTAAYLDTEGRREAKKLASPVSMVYASESMRLTTRLLDLASWLLIRRSLKAGEITESEARLKRQKVKLRPVGRPSHISHFDDLPEGLQELIRESCALYDRIVKLDRAMSWLYEETEGDRAPAAGSASRDNPVGHQIEVLRQAFGR